MMPETPLPGSAPLPAEPDYPQLFHDHLDRCSRCRHQPFNLCRDGQALLEKAADTVHEHLPGLQELGGFK